jgi:TPR repeat protein
MYDNGLGCKEDKEEALAWCRKAASQGHFLAKTIIKRMIQDGEIVF